MQKSSWILALAFALTACTPSTPKSECSVDADCDDRSACTTDSCSAGACVRVPVSLDDGDACSVDSCDPATGVSHAPISVDDGDACTIDSCDPGTGVKHEQVDDGPGGACSIVVSPTSGHAIAESAGTTTFTVVLRYSPSAPVTIGLSSSDPTEGEVSPSSVTFNSSNWSVPQTVTVTAVNDAIDDGDVSFQVVTAPAQSNDPLYAGRDASDVNVVTLDDDTAGVQPSPTEGLVTDESGSSTTFVVVLTSEPLAPVTVPLLASAPGEGQLSVSSLTFLPGDWNVPQSVVVTGVDDTLADGPVDYFVMLGEVTSEDPKYAGMNPPDVTIRNLDDDTPGITVITAGDLTVSEDGAVTATFSLRLDSRPTATVRIPLASSDTTEGVVEPAELVFSAADWNVPQPVTIRGVDDVIDDGTQTYAILVLPAASDDPNYSGRDGVDVPVSTTDDDTAGITVTPTSGLQTSEDIGEEHSTTFTIVLQTEPVADVVIGLSSSVPTEGTVSPASLTFTATNWNAPQVVTVTGVDDEANPVADGRRTYFIVTAPASSADLVYNGIDADDVTVQNLDDETPHFRVKPARVTVAEGDATAATFSIRLGAPPTANVTVPISVSDSTEAAVSPASLVFTAVNWNAYQIVTVTSVEDMIEDGPVESYVVTGAATSTDLRYQGLNPDDVTVTTTDNDTAGVTVSKISGLATDESGKADTFRIWLHTQPTANVVVALSVTDTTEVSVSPASVTFTTNNWNAQTLVTVTGRDDDLIDGNQLFTVITAAATSTDGRYNGMAVPDVDGVNDDNDSAGVIYNPTTVVQVDETGTTATVRIRLTSAPSANVVLPIATGDATEASVTPAQLTFTPTNWATQQTVTITGVDDQVKDGTQSYEILVGPATSGDPDYDGFNPANIPARTTDNDTSGFTVTPTTLTLSENGMPGSVTVKLRSEPTADVTIPLESSRPEQFTVSPASLVLTSQNWSAGLVATVTPVNDPIDDGNQAGVLRLLPAQTTDGEYANKDPVDVNVTVNDDDTAAVLVSPTSLTTRETGTSATFDVRLQTEPTGDVVLTLVSSDVNEVIVSTSALTFTTANWSAPQTVTVTGQDDIVRDGNRTVTIQITTHQTNTTDPVYRAINPPDVSVTNEDDETAGFVVNPTQGLVTTEGGGFAKFTVRLTSQPRSNVTINLASTRPTEGEPSPSSLTFTPQNWAGEQEVTVTGKDDLLPDGDVSYTITTGAAVSQDSFWVGINPPDVSVTNRDND